MQGLYVSENGGISYTRPRSKKQVRELIAEDPRLVSIEATSVFGNEYDGPADEMPHDVIYFVGPDPYNKRNFYGRLIRTNAGFQVK